MSAGLYVPPHGNLLFHWERPRRRQLAIAGFLVASVGLHAFCFLLFQVIYPSTISLLPPPARVSLIAPNSEDGRNFLHWLAAEDPALTSETQRPADARAYQLPRLSHIPSYIAVPPSLKPLPSVAESVAEPTSLPPGMVTVKTPTAETPPLVAPSTLLFSGDLAHAAFSAPPLQFKASLREAPQDARFRVAVDRGGVIRYALLESSSGDAALDEEVRHVLALTRFRPDAFASLPNEKLSWATATLNFGSDLALPPAAEPAP
ncbi:MAG: energy transducer TonB [Chthoniobacterales bacterium]